MGPMHNFCEIFYRIAKIKITLAIEMICQSHWRIDELSFDQVICRDKEKFPIKKSRVIYSSFSDCKANLDRVQDASYIDLTYRIRWDHDRLDLYRPNNREILICDGNILTTYEHNEKKDPDWWMIVRNSLDYVECADEISIQALD